MTTAQLTQFSGKISVSQHAIDEAIKDFRINPKVAEDWIRSNLRKSSFIANIISEDGKPNRLFGFQRIAFVLADTEDYVITVYPQNHATSPLQSKVRNLVLRELSKLERKERITERAVRIEKAKLAISIAECQWRMEMTPSAKVIRANNEMIASTKARIAELDKALYNVKKEKKAVAKSVIMFI